MSLQSSKIVEVNALRPKEMLENVALNKFLTTLAGPGGVGKTSLAMGLHSEIARALSKGVVKGPSTILALDPDNKVIGQAVAPCLRLVFDEVVLKALLQSDAKVKVAAAVHALKDAILASSDDVGRQILLEMTQSNRNKIQNSGLATSLSLYFDAANTKMSLYENILSVGAEIKDRVDQSSVDDIAFALSELAMIPQIWRSLWAHISNDELNKIVATMFDAIGKMFGYVAALKSEMTISEPGISYQLDNAIDNLYVGTWPRVTKKNHRFPGVTTSLSMKPEEIALGLSMICAVRIGTITSAFSVDYSDFTDTLKGGLKEGMVMELQRLNDLAARIGARIIVEARDDYEANATGNDEKAFELNSDGISASSRRLMSSAHSAIYITSKGRFWIRFRAYTETEQEGELSGVVYGLADIPNLKSDINGIHYIDWHVSTTGLSHFETIQKLTKTKSIGKI